MMRARTSEEQAQYLKEQIKEMEGPDNTWFATQALGHTPTQSEAAEHYIKHGGAADFAKRWQEEAQRQGV
jgi:hypothetical protein